MISRVAPTRLVGVLVALTLLSSGCATVERKPLAADEAAKIKSVSVVNYPPIEKIGLWGVPRGSGSEASMGLLLFGAIGGAIAGGIQAGITNTRLEALNVAMKDHVPPLRAMLEDELSKLLVERGIQVDKVPMPETKPDSKELAFSKIQTNADAVVAIGIGFAGLDNNSNEPGPVIIGGARLYRPKSEDQLMYEPFAYGMKPEYGAESWTLLEVDAKHRIPTLDSAAEHKSVVAEGLVEGVRKIAVRIADLIKPPRR